MNYVKNVLKVAKQLYEVKNKMKTTKWDNYGESSLTLLSAYCGITKASPTIPYDPSDFVRCVHLIKCLDLTLEEEKNLLNHTAFVYPIWKPYAKKWGKLMGLYIKEKNKKQAPKLYKALQKLRSV